MAMAMVKTMEFVGLGRWPIGRARKAKQTRISIPTLGYLLCNNEQQKERLEATMAIVLAGMLWNAFQHGIVEKGRAQSAIKQAHQGQVHGCCM